MNWIQQNKKLAGILGVMITGVIGLGVWLFMAWSGYSAAKENWDGMSSKVTALEKSKDYPSKENVAQAGAKLAEYRDKFSLLRNVLLSPELQEPVTPISETEFQAKVKERAKFVREKAAAAGIKEFPKDKEFALGFDEYASNLPPSADVAADLNVQLDAMEKFVTVLVDSGIRSLDLLERTKLADEKGGAPKVVAPPAPPKGAQKKSKGKAAPVAVAAPGQPVLDRYTIKCVFTTDQRPLQNVMNALSNPAKIHDFLAVRMLRVENEKVDAPTKAEIQQLINSDRQAAADPTGSDRPAGGKKALAGNVIEPPAPAKRDATAIMGQEMLKVYMEVDYIRFRQPAEAVTSGDAPKN